MSLPFVPALLSLALAAAPVQWRFSFTHRRRSCATTFCGVDFSTALRG